MAVGVRVVEAFTRAPEGPRDVEDDGGLLVAVIDAVDVVVV